jgi:pimeloyl-ACP methyl ester carboxylesterase
LPDVVLLHSPLVGPSSVAPTAQSLEARGVRCLTPSPYASGAHPAWRDWPAVLLRDLPQTHAPVIVGHSMAGLLAARLASALDASGVICLDASMPPEAGATPTLGPSFRSLLATLPVEDGRLPPWHQWWPGDVFQNVAIAPDVRAQVIRDIPRLRLDWFDDAFDMPDWARAKRAFIRTGAWFDAEADRAEARGWPTIRLNGTHLHPATHPEETAAAILDCIARMGVS